MKKNAFAISLFLLVSPLVSTADIIPLPAEDPVALVTIPDTWAPEESEEGVLAQSPDGAAITYFEIADSVEKLDALIEANLAWLIEDNGVALDQDSMDESEFTEGNRTWNRIAWSGESSKTGPALVGILFSEVGGSRILTVTYWIDKEGSEKSLEILQKIFASVKSVE